MKPSSVTTAAHLAMELGESPIWDYRNGCLIWVDITQGRIYTKRPDTSATLLTTHPGTVSAVALLADGNYLAAIDRGIAVVNATSGEIGEIRSVAENQTRLNDGAADHAGRYWVGSMALDGADGKGQLYLLSGGDRPRSMVAPVGISNGIGWSLDRRRMYYTDTDTGRVDMFDFDPETAALSNRRQFADIPAVDGAPDGLTVDSDDHVWIALWDGWAVRRYSPAGDHVDTIDLPVARPTSCTFGGEHLDTLYITTASVGLTCDERLSQPAAGDLFQVVLPRRGQFEPEVDRRVLDSAIRT